MRDRLKSINFSTIINSCSFYFHMIDKNYSLKRERESKRILKVDQWDSVNVKKVEYHCNVLTISHW